MLPVAQFEAWTMEDCDYGRPLSQLVTVVIQGHSHGQVFGPFWLLRSILSVQVIRMVKSLQEAYPGVAAIVETDLNLAQVTCAMSKKFSNVHDIMSFQASLDFGEGVEILAPAELSRVASRWEWISNFGQTDMHLL